MSKEARPRKRLPARVYWTRRLLVLGLALGLVFGVAHLLDGDGADKSGTAAARPVGADASQPSSGLTPGAKATTRGGSGKQNNHKQNSGKQGSNLKPRKVKTPLAMPTGPCADSDVRVEPSVDGEAYAGQDVAITLNLTTLASPACTWEVSPASVVVKLTSGSDRVWSTQDCPRAIERQSVVVRKDHTTKVDVTWNGQRSQGECSRTTDWAQPGYYHAEAAALGAEPADQQFELQTPQAPTITPEPKPQKTSKTD